MGCGATGPSFSFFLECSAEEIDLLAFNPTLAKAKAQVGRNATLQPHPAATNRMRARSLSFPGSLILAIERAGCCFCRARSGTPQAVQKLARERAEAALAQVHCSACTLCKMYR